MSAGIHAEAIKGHLLQVKNGEILKQKYPSLLSSYQEIHSPQPRWAIPGTLSMWYVAAEAQRG